MSDNIQNNIRWGQSWNLAVDMVAPAKYNSQEVEDVVENIKNWQRFFYEELGKRPPEVCESCGGAASITTGGILEPIVNGQHPKCRKNEGYKLSNL